MVTAHLHTNSMQRASWQQSLRVIGHLAHHSWPVQYSLSYVRQIRKQLAALPLTPRDYKALCQRLDNAHRYFQSGENGAASFELDLVAGALRHFYREFGRRAF